jgi:hypothetical protein
MSNPRNHISSTDRAYLEVPVLPCSFPGYGGKRDYVMDIVLKRFWRRDLPTPDDIGEFVAHIPAFLEEV